MKKLILLVASAFVINQSQAQLSIAPEVGLGMTSNKIKINDVKLDSKMIFGFRAGANVGLRLTNNLLVEGGLFYAQRGSDNESPILGNVTTKINYIDIPLYLNFLAGDVDKGQVFFGAGPYISYCIGGKNKIGGVSSDLEVGSEAVKDNVTGTDFGININAGYQLTSGLYFRAFYSYGLANIHPGGDDNNLRTNRGLGINVGYRFKF